MLFYATFAFITLYAFADKMFSLPPDYAILLAAATIIAITLPLDIFMLLIFLILCAFDAHADAAHYARHTLTLPYDMLLLMPPCHDRYADY